MAGTTVPVRVTALPGSDVEQLRLQLNKAVDDLDALRTTVAAMRTAAATSLAAIAAVTAPAAVTAAKVATVDGATT